MISDLLVSAVVGYLTWFACWTVMRWCERTWRKIQRAIEFSDDASARTPDDRTTQAPVEGPPERYTRDWSAIARRHKIYSGWQCSNCGVYCGGEPDDRRLLHVHHRDLNSRNNDLSNLEALCVVCHSERPGVGHRRLAAAITSDGRRQHVYHLRQRQGAR
jgi:hypothetical protein